MSAMFISPRLCRALRRSPLPQQTDGPSIEVVGQKDGPGEAENVDCVTAKEMVKQCDAKCVLGAPAPQTLVGYEVSTTYSLYT